MKRYLPLLGLLVALGALAASQVATAAAPSRPTSTFAHLALRDAAEPEEEAGEVEIDECEAPAEELDEGEEEFQEEGEGEEEEFEASCEEEKGEEEETGKAAPKGAPFVTAPVACQVRQAESRITALPGSSQVRINVRYQAYSPTQVTVGVKLKDRKGSVAIEHATRHVSLKGVLRITVRLGAAVMERALAAREFDVSLRAPETPGFCAGTLEQRLHRSTPGARVYSG